MLQDPTIRKEFFSTFRHCSNVNNIMTAVEEGRLNNLRWEVEEAITEHLNNHLLVTYEEGEWSMHNAKLNVFRDMKRLEALVEDLIEAKDTVAERSL